MRDKGTYIMQMSLEAGEKLLQRILSVDPYIVSDNTSSVLPCAASRLTPLRNKEYGDDRPVFESDASDTFGTPDSNSLSKSVRVQDATSQMHDHGSAYMFREQLSVDALNYMRGQGSPPPTEQSEVNFTIQTAVGLADVIAKPSRVHQDMWDSLVAPSISCRALRVESWLHGWHRLPNMCQSLFCVVNAAGVRIDMPNNRTSTMSLLADSGVGSAHEAPNAVMQWGIYQDHAKWAVCCNKAAVCFGDMNRMQSQQKRGGLAICYRPLDAGSVQFSQQLHRQLSSWLTPAAKHCSGCACSGG